LRLLASSGGPDKDVPLADVIAYPSRAFIPAANRTALVLLPAVPKHVEQQIRHHRTCFAAGPDGSSNTSLGVERIRVQSGSLRHPLRHPADDESGIARPVAAAGRITTFRRRILVQHTCGNDRYDRSAECSSDAVLAVASSRSVRQSQRSSAATPDVCREHEDQSSMEDRRRSALGDSSSNS